MALTVLFAGCVWQSRPLLDVLNRPLSTVSAAGSGLPGRADSPAVRSALARSGRAFEQLSRSTTLSVAERRAAGAAAGALAAATHRLGASALSEADQDRSRRAVLDLDHGRRRVRALQPQVDMQDEFTAAIERLTQRRVTAFLSANQTAPGVACDCCIGPHVAAGPLRR